MNCKDRNVLVTMKVNLTIYLKIEMDMAGYKQLRKNYRMLPN